MLLLVLLAGGLWGCGNSPIRPLPIRHALRLSYWGSPAEVAIMNRLVARFETEHPSIDVIPMHVPDNYFQKLHIWMAARLTPDVMMMNSLMMPVYASAGQLQDWTPWLGKMERAAFDPAGLAAFQEGKTGQKSALFAVPRDVSTLVVFYNKTLLNRLGIALPSPSWTWNEALQKGQQATDRTHAPKRWGWSFNNKPPLFWLPFVWSWGGDWLSPQHPGQVDWQQSQAKAGLIFYRALRHRWHVAPSLAELGTTQPTQLFLQGRLAFLISGRWSVPFFREKATFDWDIAPFPAGPAGSKVGVDASGYAVAQSSQHPALARQLARFLTSASAQQEWAATGLILPSRTAIAQQMENQEQTLRLKPAHSPLFRQAAQTGIPTRTSFHWNEQSEQLTEMLTPLFDQPDATVSQLINHAQAKSR